MCVSLRPAPHCYMCVREAIVFVEPNRKKSPHSTDDSACTRQLWAAHSDPSNSLRPVQHIATATLPKLCHQQPTTATRASQQQRQAALLGQRIAQYTSGDPTNGPCFPKEAEAGEFKRKRACSQPVVLRQ